MATLVLRNVKGSELTYVELDANFTNLNTEVAGKQPTGTYATGTGTASGTNTGDQTITLTGGVTGTGTGSFVATVVTNANMVGEVTSVGNTTTVTNAAVIGKVLTGYVSGTGVVVATDTILQAVNKLNGNDLLKAPLASPVFTGNPTAPTAADANNDTSLATTAFVQREKENLLAISQSLHIGVVAKAIIYDTSKDSDGGAWRKRCTDKSWFTETLGGNRWIGQRASIGAAWTAAGATTGAIYQSTADGRYHTPTTSSTQTEVFRGIVSEFPVKVAIVLEGTKAVIYDMTAPGCPMWMVFVGNSTSINIGAAIPALTNTCIAALNGSFFVGSNDTGTWYSGIWSQSFLTDSTTRMANSAASVLSRKLSGLAKRNVQESYLVIDTTKSLVHQAVNDVAVTVLDNAPIDPATGLPVPTVAVATAGGLSTITNSGTVVNSTATTSVVSVDFDGLMLKAIRSDGVVAIYNNVATLTNAPSTTLSASTIPAIMGTATRGSVRSKGSSTGVTRIQRNSAVNTSSMVAHITNAYNSGWQVGDSRFCGLADVVAETITAPELVANGTFTTSDLTSWSAINATLSVAANQLVCTSTASVGGAMQAYTPFATVIGKTYRASAQLIGVSGASFNGASVKAADSGFTQLQQISTTTTAQTITLTFVATTTVSNIVVRADSSLLTTSDTATWDNISVKLADPDRSVKANAMSIVGSLVKTAVALGTQLVSYSGFSAANCLSQPYSANHDYSTTGFSGAVWIKESTSAAIEYIFSRDSVTPAQAIRLWITAAGLLTMELYDGTTTRTAVGTVSVSDSTWKLVQFDYLAGTLNLYVNGVSYATATGAALLTLSNAVALFQIGLKVDGTLPLSSGSVALLRMSATIPSSDQRSQVYRDELQLFQPGAQCTLAGTSAAVTALAYDESTDVLHVGTSWGRSALKGLLRTESEITTTGALTSLSASQGVILTGGTSAKIYQPALQLRDELARKEEARRALGKVPVFIDITATASQTAFVLVKGYTIKGLYKNGTLMRETTTGVFWTRSNDGYQETATLSVGATVGDWISLMCIRSN